LYFDNNRGIYVGSGKIVWQGFVVAKSKKDKPETDLYILYPSKHGSRNNKRDVLGHFENLTQVVVDRFDASSVPAMLMDKNH
jgi:hypothetical protein